MGHQVRPRTSQGFGKRPDKAKLKAKADKRRSTDNYPFMEENVPTSKEVLDRTLNSLQHLGEQRFAIAPFYDHFGRWLLSLRTVLSEIESSPSIHADDQFRKECSDTLSTIELALEQKRLKEISHDESIRKISQNLRDTRNLLTQTEREHAAKVRKITYQKEREVKPVTSKVGRLREELNRIIRTKPGFLRGILKSSAQREAEAAQKLNSTKRELERIEQSFAAERKRLEDEYKGRSKELLEKIDRLQKEVEGLETSAQIDDALDVRRRTCESLTSALSGLLRRMEPTPETSSLLP